MPTPRERLTETTKKWYPGKGRDIWSGSQADRFKSLTDPRRLAAEGATRALAGMDITEAKQRAERQKWMGVENLREEGATRRESMKEAGLAARQDKLLAAGKLASASKKAGALPPGMLTLDKSISFKKGMNEWLENEHMKKYKKMKPDESGYEEGFFEPKTGQPLNQEQIGKFKEAGRAKYMKDYMPQGGSLYGAADDTAQAKPGLEPRWQRDMVLNAPPGGVPGGSLSATWGGRTVTHGDSGWTDTAGKMGSRPGAIKGGATPKVPSPGASPYEASPNRPTNEAELLSLSPTANLRNVPATGLSPTERIFGRNSAVEKAAGNIGSEFTRRREAIRNAKGRIPEIPIEVARYNEDPLAAKKALAAKKRKGLAKELELNPWEGWTSF